MSEAVGGISMMSPLVIGLVVAAVLYGIVLIQACLYFFDNRDRLPTRTLVAMVIISEACHQVLITCSVYSYLIKYYGQSEMPARLEKSLLIGILFNGFTAFLVQALSVRRIWVLCREWYVRQKCWLTGTAALFVAGKFGCVIVYTILSLGLETFTELAYQLKSLLLIFNVLGIIADVIIVSIVGTILYRLQTGVSRTDLVLRRLIWCTINSGVLTSVCTLASLISFLLIPSTLIHIMFFFCIGRFYATTLLANLNARKSLDEIWDQQTTQSPRAAVSIDLRPYPSPMATELELFDRAPSKPNEAASSQECEHDNC